MKIKHTELSEQSWIFFHCSDSEFSFFSFIYCAIKIHLLEKVRVMKILILVSCKCILIAMWHIYEIYTFPHVFFKAAYCTALLSVFHSHFYKVYNLKIGKEKEKHFHAFSESSY